MAEVKKPRSPLVAQLQGVHLFHFDGAPCAQRVRFALAEKGLLRGPDVRWQSTEPNALQAAPGTWTSRQVSLVRKEHVSAEYAAIQPHMVVPALVHDGRLYIESMDIIEYLDDAFAGPRLVPRDAGLRAEALRLVDTGKSLHNSIRHVTYRWSLGRLGVLGARHLALLDANAAPQSPDDMRGFHRRLHDGAITQATFVEHLHRLEHGFDEIETLLASDRRAFLVGAEMTVADIIWSIKVQRLTETLYPFELHYPNLSRWFKRVADRPGFKGAVTSRARGSRAMFRVRARIEHWAGRGIAQASSHARNRAAAA